MQVKPLDIDRLRRFFRYDPESGKLYWRVQRPNGVKAGDEAGYLHSNGYLTVRSDGRTIYVHQIAWCLYHGEQVPLVDHRDRVRANNRIENLRSSTKPLNAANSAVRKDNKTGVRGVYFDKRLGKYRAQIRLIEGRRHLGVFETLKDAAVARTQAEICHWGEYRGE